MKLRGPARFVFLPLAFTVLGLLGAWPGESKPSSPHLEQMRFGVEMARRGLWGEALFRFQQADRLAPDNPRVINNIAVALEAAGRYEEALAAYQRAARLDPGNGELKRNYARFVEFYQAFKPADPAAAKPPALVPATGGAQ